jgi:creatinine amidohydrolase
MKRILRSSGAPLLFFLILLKAPIAFAAVPNTVFLIDLTWTELRDQIRSGKTTIIIPVGGTEENGPQMALGKHDVRVRILAERIARDLGNALVAPVIAYVPEGRIHPPTGHMGFPGTITIPVAAFEGLLEGAARSMKSAGFRDIVLIGDHGGYQRELKIVAERLNRRWAKTQVRAHAILEYYRVSFEGFNRLLERRGYPAAEVGTHAGLADTSLLLAVAPSLVRQDVLHSGIKFGPKDGVSGDPRRASAALGELGVTMIVKQTVAAIRTAVTRR